MRSVRLRLAIPMSGRQDVQSIKPGGRPPQSPSPLTPSVIPDARGPRRRGFKASAPFAGRNAADRRQREIERVGHCRMKTPPRKNSRSRASFLDCPIPHSPRSREPARVEARSHAPTRRLIDINTGAPRSASMAISEWSPKADAVPAESLDRGRCSRPGPTYFAPPNSGE